MVSVIFFDCLSYFWSKKKIMFKYVNIFIGKFIWDFIDEKIIMLVGVIGLGKSIFVNGIVNYIMGVNFDDLFWFIMVMLEKEEDKLGN